MRQYLVDDNFIRRFEQMERWIRNFRGAGVTNTPEGASIAIPRERTQPPPSPPPTSRGMFPVKVEKTGGSDGTKLGPASWTYTVRSMDWAGSGTSADYELGTGKSPRRRRPNGKASFPAGSINVGVGYYDELGVFQLWDANEIYGTGGC